MRPLRTFRVGQQVIARDYRNNGQKWQSGTVASQAGPLTYKVNISQDLVWRRHVDQLLDAAEPITMDAEPTPCSDSLELSDQAQDIVIPEDDAGGSGCDPPVAQSPAVSPTPVRHYPDRIGRPPERLRDSFLDLYFNPTGLCYRALIVLVIYSISMHIGM